MAKVPFSKRYGYTGQPKEITIWEDAPKSLRLKVIKAAREAAIGSGDLRTIICDALEEQPNRENWSADNIWGEIEGLLFSCEWPLVYNVIEDVDEHLTLRDGGYGIPIEGAPHAPGFAAAINEFFVEKGIGWKLDDGEIVTRGEESFETAVRTAQSELKEAGRPTAASRIHEALQALSRRPEPDPAGAISHAIAALECVASDITGDTKATFGDILKKHSELFPGGLKKGLEGVWGYSCNEGARHGKEGKEPERAEAELIVGLAATVATYLNKKHSAQ